MFTRINVIHAFVGRRAELSHLLDTIRNRRKRPHLIAITGKPGIGKTAFANKFLEGLEHEFQSIWVNRYVRDQEGDGLFDLVLDEVRRGKKDALVVVDDTEPFDEKTERFVRHLLGIKKVYAVLVTLRELKRSMFYTHRVELPPLTPTQSTELLRTEIHVLEVQKLSDEDTAMFVSKAAGNPAVLLAIAALLGKHTVDQIRFKLDEGPHDLGFKLPAQEKQLIKLVAPKIILANEALVHNLKRYPQDLHRVSPRKFEELVAELLDDMGCEVELTPASKDGGKDIIATMETEIGKILCLVEAKHYSPNRPVQVNLVRQLFGTYMDYGASSAMLVTSSRFTRGAKEFQSRHEYQIQLREYDDIVKWIQKYKTK